MRVKQAKLAQALRGETSNLIDDKKYELEFDKGMLHARLKLNPRKIGPFIVFPANIAFIEVHEDVNVTEDSGAKDDKPIKTVGKSKK